jgi:hypothetical protein
LAVTFDDALRALNESEVGFEQRAVASVRGDVNIVTCGVTSVRCKLAPANRQLGTVRGDAGSNGCDLTADDGDVPTLWRHVFSH